MSYGNNFWLFAIGLAAWVAYLESITENPWSRRQRMANAGGGSGDTGMHGGGQSATQATPFQGQSGTSGQPQGQTGEQAAVLPAGQQPPAERQQRRA